MPARSIIITMGDPAGVGPEVICKAIAETTADRRSDITIIGSRPVLERANALCQTNLEFGDSHALLIDIETDGVADVPAGMVSATAGEAAYSYIVRAVEMASAGGSACIVTAPINKASLNAAGHHYDGHTS